MTRCLVLLFFAALWLAPMRGQAQTADEIYASLATTDFEQIRHGVMALSVSGDPHAQSVITALQNNRLYMRPDKALFIKTDAGTFVEALSGATSDVSAGALKPVRVNNAVRGAIDAALGVLRLFSPDASTRLDAAEAVFVARDPAALPALDKALAKETDAAVRRRIEQARAAAVLASTDAADADRLAATGDQGDAGGMGHGAFLLQQLSLRAKRSNLFPPWPSTEGDCRVARRASRSSQ